LAALDNGLYDVRGEICKPQEPADMRFAEAIAPRNLSGIGEFKLTKLMGPERPQFATGQPVEAMNIGRGVADAIVYPVRWRRRR
jgi:hypothetical protein